MFVAVDTAPDVLCLNLGWRIAVRGVTPVKGVGSRELYADGVYRPGAGVGENILEEISDLLSGSICLA